MTWKITVALITIAMFIMTACSPITGDVTAEQPIKIGFIGPLTGEVAFLGEASLQGIEVAVDEINAQGGIQGRSVEIVVEDDQLTDSLTRTAYHKLVDVDNVDVILSVSYGGILSLAEQAEQDKVVIVDTIDTSEELAEIGDYVFAIGIYDEGIGYAIAEHAEKIGKKKVAVVYYQAEPFIVYVKDAMKQKLEELGGEVVIEQGYAPDESDFRTVIMKAQKAGAESIVMMGYDEAGFALKQAKEMGVEMTFIGIDSFSSEVFQEIAGDATEGAYFTFWEASDAEEYQTFTEQFEAKYGEGPILPLFAATSYDSMKVVAEAMEHAEGGEEIKEALYKIEGHDGIAGDITMGSDGIVRSIQEEMYQFQEGKIVKAE
jgi:branched-chain amino acid transport system substrate-binding protein